jgi:hypothetical protein
LGVVSNFSPAKIELAPARKQKCLFSNGHFSSSGAQSYHGFWHQDPRRCNHSHQVPNIYFGLILEWSALYPHECIHRNTFGCSGILHKVCNILMRSS